MKAVKEGFWISLFLLDLFTGAKYCEYHCEEYFIQYIGCSLKKSLRETLIPSW